MSSLRYQALGPLLSGEGSRAFLGLMLPEKAPAQPIVLIWVPNDVATDPEQAGALAKETLRASILEHPNIVRVYGMASLDEGLARIVEFADGETLRKVLEIGGKLPPRLAGKVAADAAMGLHFAHLAGNDDGTPLLHGDLRPETLMVSFGGGVKVAGYGALSVAPREAGGKRVVHRRRYCAPEQIVGGRTAITIQTDVYLLGLVLYECLTGKMPFQDEPDFDTAVLSTPLPIDSEDIPPELQTILARATAKRSVDRYPSAREFREAVEKALGPIAPNEELSAHLEGGFPVGDPTRAERRRLLDAGIADWAKKLWEVQAERAQQMGAEPPPAPRAPAPPPEVAPAPIPAPVAAAPAALPPKPAPVAARPPAPRPPPRPRASIEDEVSIVAGTPLKKASRWPLVFAGGLAVGAGALFFGRMFLTPPQAAPIALPVAVNPAPPVASPAAVLPGTLPPQVGQPASGTPESPATPTVASGPTAGAPVTAVAKAESPEQVAPKPKPAVYTPPPPPRLEVLVTPTVNVRLDGKSVGKTPVMVVTKPGRHVLTLTNRAQGIDLRRVVMVDRTGTTTERITLGKAYFSINVPDGSEVYLDGRLVGTHSLKDYGIIEGSHNVRVMLGTAKWEQGFDVAADEHMSYDVNKTSY